MPRYRVTTDPPDGKYAMWYEIDATTPQKAAQEAHKRKFYSDPCVSTCTVWVDTGKGVAQRYESVIEPIPNFVATKVGAMRFIGY